MKTSHYFIERRKDYYELHKEVEKNLSVIILRDTDPKRLIDIYDKITLGYYKNVGEIISDIRIKYGDKALSNEALTILDK